jgi:hypothetical protein
VGQAAGLEEAGAQIVQRLQPAAQGERQQQHRGDDDIDHAQAHPRHGVVGRLLVGVEADRGGEGGGHRGPVGGHVGGLAPGQPQAAQQADAQGDEEQGGEAAGGHGRADRENGEGRSIAGPGHRQPPGGRRIAPLPQKRPIMAQDQNHLIWLDMEMTGLNPDSDRIIEMAMVVTNSKLDVIAEGPVIAVHQPDAVLDAWTSGTRTPTAAPA